MSDTPPVIEPTVPPAAPVAEPDVITDVIADETPAAPPALDLDTLSELERQVVEKFQEREAQSPPTPVDTPPVIPVDNSAIEIPTPPATIDSAPAPDRTPDGTLDPSLEAPIDADAASILTFNDTAYTEADVANMVELREWAQSLDETASASIQAALSGDYVLVPITDIPAIERFYAEQNNPAPVTPPATPPEPQFDGLGNLIDTDPRLDQVTQEVAQLREAELRRQQETQLTSIRQQIDAGAEQFIASQPDLTADDITRINQYVIENQIYAGLSAVHPPSKAIQLAYQQAIAVDPTISSRRQQAAIDAQVATQMEALRVQQQATMGSTALSGSSAPMGQATPPQTPDDAMVAIIAQHMQS